MVSFSVGVSGSGGEVGAGWGGDGGFRTWSLRMRSSGSLVEIENIRGLDLDFMSDTCKDRYRSGENSEKLVIWLSVEAVWEVLSQRDDSL